MTSKPGPHNFTSPESSVHHCDFEFKQNDHDYQYNEYGGNYDINDDDNYDNNPWGYSPSYNKDSEDDREPSHPENASNIRQIYHLFLNGK